MESMRDAKRKREKGKNWSANDKTLLIDIVHEFRSVIENNATNSKSNQAKNLAWEQIGNKFNLTSEVQRSVESLQSTYRNLKTLAKKENAALKVSQVSRITCFIIILFFFNNFKNSKVFI